MLNPIDRFLKCHNMHADDVDIEQVCGLFLEEMRAGLQGKDSSLAMYPSFLTVLPVSAAEKKITAVDVGGTHVRVSQIHVGQNGHTDIEKFESFSMIEKQTEFDIQEFFRYLAEMIVPYTSRIDGIGISFAFPGRVTNDRDLVIANMAKEIHVRGIEGASLRNSLNRAFLEICGKEFPITVVNDGVASLLAAIAGKDMRQYGSLTGLIVGTGTNSCYLERVRQIGKHASFGHDTDLINMESGSFSKYIGGDFDRLLDKNSALPGDHLFEKMVGGKYLASIVYFSALAAQREGIISGNYNLSFLRNGTAKDVDALLKDETKGEDTALIRQIANNLVKRASKLLAANLWATIKKQGNVERKALISVEGTTIAKLCGFRAMTENELRDCTKKLPVEWVSAQDAVIRGAAIAAAEYC